MSQANLDSPGDPAERPGPERDFENYKVVISCKNGERLHSVLHSRIPANLEALLQNASPSFPGNQSTFYTQQGDPLAFEMADVKALFFVNSFRGDRSRKSIRFYENGPEIQDLWVEVQFADGEVLEGTVNNSIAHLMEPGFFLRPSDPVCNNYLVYVNKDALRSYRVLGLRAISSTRPNGH